MWYYLRRKQINGLKFRRQQPIGNYIVDFVCFDKKIIIELDGSQHIENANYDSQRDEWLKSQGFKIFRFWNNEFLNKAKETVEYIAMQCDTPPLPNPLPSRERE